MILSYSLISSVILIFGYIAYRIFMSGKCQHTFNRKLLLLIYASSLLIPIAVLVARLHSPYAATGFSAIEIENQTPEIIESPVKEIPVFLESTRVIDLIYIIYISGVVIAAVYSLYGIGVLWRITKQGETKEFGTFKLILVDDIFKIAPFSWDDAIVMRKSDYEEDGDVILIHEYAHRRLRHWYDLVLAYITICLQWYNPAAWAMREELKVLHEYQADQSVIDAGVNISQYQMILLKRAAGSKSKSFVNGLNSSVLKKRVIMMYENNTSLKRKLLAILLVPAIGAGILITAIPSVSSVLESLATATNDSLSVDVPVITEKNEEREVYVAVETPAEFPGGMKGLLTFLQNNISYPESALRDQIEGRVIVKFIVEVDGTITNAEVVKGVTAVIDEEALRLVYSMPRWTSGEVGGKSVASYFTIPINFRLN